MLTVTLSRAAWRNVLDRATPRYTLRDRNLRDMIRGALDASNGMDFTPCSVVCPDERTRIELEDMVTGTPRPEPTNASRLADTLAAWEENE